jgi:hypothetical protein
MCGDAAGNGQENRGDPDRDVGHEGNLASVHS